MENQNIFLATNEDLEQVRIWLEEEYNKNNSGFYVNFNLIENFCKEKNLYVYKENNQVLGFISDFTKTSDIMSVKEEQQRKGIGTKLVNFIFNKAKKYNISVIKIECNPTSSVNFWKKMGFYIIEKSGMLGSKFYGFKIIDFNFKVPEGEKVKVKIRSFTNDNFFKNKINPVDNILIEGVLDKNNIIHFEKRLVFIYDLNLSSKIVIRGDPYLEILVNDKEIYSDKAKYGTKFNIQSDKYCIYIDQLKLT